MVSRGREWEMEELDKGDQKVHTFSYKINKFGDVMYNIMAIVHNTILYI